MSKAQNLWFVSRQVQWPDGDQVVEISKGSIDYSNPGMLVTKYRGEGEEYIDPREAVRVAIEIAQAWAKDQPRPVFIGRGCTGGMTIPFDPEELTEEVFVEYREWANKTATTLPECDQCGELLGKVTYMSTDSACVDATFCREYCVEKFIARQREYADEIDEILEVDDVA